jgi:hypothetical protein
MRELPTQAFNPFCAMLHDTIFFYIFFEIGAGGTAQLVGPCHPQAALQAPLFIKNSTNHLPQTDYYP